MLATAEANRSISRNLCHAMSAYSQSNGHGKRVLHPGLTIIDSGLEYVAFNAALLPDPVQVTAFSKVCFAANATIASRAGARRRPRTAGGPRLRSGRGTIRE